MVSKLFQKIFLGAEANKKLQMQLRSYKIRVIYFRKESQDSCYKNNTIHGYMYTGYCVIFCVGRFAVVI